MCSHFISVFDPVHCPEGWTLGFNSCYKKFKKQSYQGAKDVCAQEGGSQIVGPDYDIDFLRKQLGYVKSKLLLGKISRTWGGGDGNVITQMLLD